MATLKQLLDAHRKIIIERTFIANDYNQRQTAKVLGISLITLIRDLKRFGILFRHLSKGVEQPSIEQPSIEQPIAARAPGQQSSSRTTKGGWRPTQVPAGEPATSPGSSPAGWRPDQGGQDGKR